MRGDQFSRRDLLKGVIAGTAAGVVGVALPEHALEALQRGATPGPADLLVANGKFVDGRGVVGSALTIRNGRIAAIGERGAVGAAARTIDLGGRTVIPGLFDAPCHYTRAGVNPGYEARRIERALSIVEQ